MTKVKISFCSGTNCQKVYTKIIRINRIDLVKFHAAGLSKANLRGLTKTQKKSIISNRSLQSAVLAFLARASQYKTDGNKKKWLDSRQPGSKIVS